MAVRAPTAKHVSLAVTVASAATAMANPVRKDLPDPARIAVSVALSVAVTAVVVVVAANEVATEAARGVVPSVWPKVSAKCVPPHDLLQRPHRLRRPCLRVRTQRRLKPLACHPPCWLECGNWATAILRKFKARPSPSSLR